MIVHFKVYEKDDVCVTMLGQVVNVSMYKGEVRILVVDEKRRYHKLTKNDLIAPLQEFIDVPKI